MPDISFIIPVYNAENTIDQCLQSILSQPSNPTYEIICIDDGSTDKSLSILKNYEKQYSTIRVFTQANAGQASARNHGVQHSSGTYLAFVDSDDFIAENFIQALTPFIKAAAFNMVIFDYFKQDASCSTIIPGRLFHTENLAFDLTISDPCPCNRVIKRELYIEQDLYFPEAKDLRAFEDLALIPYLTFKANAHYLPQPLYVYNQMGTSTMRRPYSLNWVLQIYTGLEILRKHGEQEKDFAKAFKHICFEHGYRLTLQRRSIDQCSYNDFLIILKKIRQLPLPSFSNLSFYPFKKRLYSYCLLSLLRLNVPKILYLFLKFTKNLH